ncbi:MAG: hypothetical protein IKQ41_10100 [Clostridia bacterium]|nr:hypothetical protein [Clostridia bacterium]
MKEVYEKTGIGACEAFDDAVLWETDAPNETQILILISAAVLRRRNGGFLSPFFRCGNDLPSSQRGTNVL